VVRSNISACGRFVVLNGLHLDRRLFQTLERWAFERRLQPQDAIQLAVCALTGSETAAKGKLPAA